MRFHIKLTENTILPKIALLERMYVKVNYHLTLET